MEPSRRVFLGTMVGAAAVAAVAGASSGVAGTKFATSLPATADAVQDLIKATPTGWSLENDSLRVGIQTTGGSLIVTSIYNKMARVDYQTGSGGRTLFEYELRPAQGSASQVSSSDGGWTIGAATFESLVINMADDVAKVGYALRLTLTRQAPVPVTVTAVFEIYEGEGGLRYYTLVRNDNLSSKLTIVNSVVAAFAFQNTAHTLHYPPNSLWESTRGALAPVAADQSNPAKAAELPKKVICVYDSGDGWSFSPELNWKTQRGRGEYNDNGQSMLPPWASINAWSGIDHLQLKTNPQCLQLVLFPGEEFEYIAINVTVFKGNLAEAKFADQLHFRKRFRFHHTSAIFNTNDWDHRDRAGYNSYDNSDVINGVPNFYYTDVIPKAEAAGFEMVMMDDHWNKTRDTIEISPGRVPAIRSFEEFTSTVRGKGFIFGLWFSLCGGNHNSGRDLADPVNVAFKKAQIVSLIRDFNMSHHMIDLTEYWQNTSVTDYSHPSDNVYRKAVLCRSMLNELVDEYPQYLPKLTSEMDIYPSQRDRSTSLIHLPNNGWNTAGCGVTGEDLSIRTALTLYGHIPMEAVYVNSGKITGSMEDYYSYMVARNTKFAEDPSDAVKWPAAGIALMGVFNKWRRHPRVQALTDTVWRPVYLGEGWDVSSQWDIAGGPYVWSYCDDNRDSALVIATGKRSSKRGVVADLRWLDPQGTYMVSDVTLDDSGEHVYAYRGTFSASALRNPGLPIDLDENSSRGKAFWVQRVSGREVQVAYADEHIESFEQRGTRQSVLVEIKGTPGAEATVVVADPVSNRGRAISVQLNVHGRGVAVVKATSLYAPFVSRSLFIDALVLESESMARTASAGSIVVRTVDEDSASSGRWVLAELTANGQWVEFTGEVKSDGFYRVDVRYKSNESRGRSQLQIDGSAAGAPYDHYYSIGMYPNVQMRERCHGLVNLTQGNHNFRFTSTGTSGSKRDVGVDFIKLTPSVRKTWARFEAESTFTQKSPGMAVENVNDPGSTPSGAGAWHKASANGSGEWVEYTVDVPTSGRFRVVTTIKQHIQRAQFQLSHDGKAVGGVVEGFLPLSMGNYSFKEIDHGYIERSSAGSVVLRYAITGKNAASSGYVLAIDSIQVIAEPYIEVVNSLQVPLWTSATPDVTMRDFVEQYNNRSNLYWSVTDQAGLGVVSVSQNGKISAVGRGTATVRIESSHDSSIAAEITVTVP